MTTNIVLTLLLLVSSASLAAVPNTRRPLDQEAAPHSPQRSITPPTPAAAAVLPTLSRKEMYEDFDALVSLVRDVMPTAAVNKAVYGFDVFESLARYRESCTSGATTSSGTTSRTGERHILVG